MKCPIKISNICLKREGFRYSKNMANFEAFCWAISEECMNVLLSMYFFAI